MASIECHIEGCLENLKDEPDRESVLASILRKLLKRTNKTESILLDALQSTNEMKSFETAKYVAHRINQAVQIVKNCNTEEDRQAYHHILTALAPEEESGMKAKVANFLGLGSFECVSATRTASSVSLATDTTTPTRCRRSRRSSWTGWKKSATARPW